ncbi:MAG: hypothetical protein DME53_11080 [Verrucomicrobia bacterium]|nr:MAG: hypothetical protein DME53_11080 [Verrucomicrobiota bacterium]
MLIPIWNHEVIRGSLAVVEIVILSTLVLATRCANYQDVFVAGNVYFVDSDCYARMTRVRVCATKPGLILRHHDFENFPQGTTPHTTAPLDYLILGLALPLKPFTAQPLDMAGAFVSPLLALTGAWFLWWWSRRMKFRYRWVVLILFAISPILVHGTEVGRPDHQSLLILLVTIGICAEWRLQTAADPPSRSSGAAGTAAATELNRLAVVSGAAWGFALWVSAYEPPVLFFIVLVTSFLLNPRALFGQDRRAGWILFATIIAAALLIERRAPSFAIPESSAIFKNWASTIGELAHVSPANPVWFRWCGYLVLLAPFLIWISVRARKDGAEGLHALAIYVLSIATYFLTIWQARWAYFFVLIFALALPELLAPIKSGTAVWIAFVLSMFPVLRDWDETLWPNETQLASHLEKQVESAQIREVALTLASSELQPFLAPWWLSPSIAYWSGQPGIAGSSHESLEGIEDSARFFLSDDQERARSILHNDNVAWVFAYDSQRVTQNSAAVLNEAVPTGPLCRVLDRTPSHAPPFLIFSAQTPACKLYRVNIER